MVVFDPCGKETGLRAPQGQRDILLLTHVEQENISEDRKDTDEVRIDCPGEYDVKGITLFGYPSFRDGEQGIVRGKNTLFILQSEDITICHLGALGHTLSSNIIENLGHIDILCVPIGNRETLAIKDIDELIRKIEPSLVIPIHYKISGFKTDIEEKDVFCKEIGNCPEASISKLNIKKKDIEGKSMEIVILENA